MRISKQLIKIFKKCALFAVCLAIGGVQFACQSSNSNSGSEGASVAQNENDDNSVKLYHVFMIRGVDMNSKLIADGDFIDAKDIAASPRPDSSFDGVLFPLTKTVVTWRKNILDALAGNPKVYIIDGKESSKKAFNELPAEKIQSVLIDGDKVEVTTCTEGDRSAFEVAGEEELRLMNGTNDGNASGQKEADAMQQLEDLF